MLGLYAEHCFVYCYYTGVLNVTILVKLFNYALMLQRIPLVNFKQKGYFEKHQSIWLKINLHEAVKRITASSKYTK